VLAPAALVVQQDLQRRGSPACTGSESPSVLSLHHPIS